MFDPNADLPVNFIYTKEQQESSAARNNLDKIRKQISRLARKIRPLKALYQAKNLSFIDEKSRFERELQQYNHHVQFLNNMGGASESDGFVLDARKEEHLHQEGDIQVRARELESMEKRVNSLIDEYNDLVGREHFYVDAMNAKAGQQFVEGMYSVSGNTREINIYYISGYRNLVALLAHELGHARGIPHNEDPKSVMSPGGEDTTGSTIGPLQFSRSDKVGLNTVCPLSND